MSEREREQEQTAAAREDLTAFARTLSQQHRRPQRQPLPGRGAFTALGLLMRLRGARRLVRLLLALLALVVVNQFLPGGSLNLGFVLQALWSAAGALTGR